MKRILLTGASRGIGRYAAEKLLQKKHKIFGISRKDPKIEHPNFTHIPFDLSDTEKLKETNFSSFQIDTLILNAGIGLFAHLEELSFEEIEYVYRVNFLSNVLLTKMLLPQMKKQKRGDIIFIGSVAGLRGKKKGSIYCSSKAALRSFAQAIREECVSSSVRVSILQPGTCDTPFYENLPFAPKKEKGASLHASDVADAISMILEMDERAVFEEIVLSPQRHAFDFKKG